MSHLIQRLEDALRVWEDGALVGQVAVAIKRHELGLVHQPTPKDGAWRELRSFLVRYRGEQFPVERFIGGEAHWSNSFSIFPASLAAWTAYSRRVFHLSGDLQAFLELTSLSNLTWGDVLWPYHAFAIELEHPIQNVRGELSDLLLVNTRPQVIMAPTTHDRFLEVRSIPISVSEHPHLSSTKRARIQRLLDQKKWYTLQREIQPYLDVMMARDQTLPAVQVPIIDTEPIEGDHIAMTPEGDVMADEQVTRQISLDRRLVIGLAMYLATIPPQSASVTHKRFESDEEVRPITHGADICRVLNTERVPHKMRHIIDEERVGRGGWVVTPHWRRGHFRRDPGEAQNPNARWRLILPYRVGYGHLAEDAQIGGSRVDVE